MAILESPRSMESSSERLEDMSEDEAMDDDINELPSISLSPASSRTSLMDLDDIETLDDDNGKSANGNHSGGGDCDDTRGLKECGGRKRRRFTYACLFCKELLTTKSTAMKHYLAHITCERKTEKVYTEDWIDEFLLYQEHTQVFGDSLPSIAECPVCNLIKKLNVQVHNLDSRVKVDYLSHIYHHCCYLPYECKVCNVKFFTFRLIKAHIIEKHPCQNVFAAIRLTNIPRLNDLLKEYAVDKVPCSVQSCRLYKSKDVEQTKPCLKFKRSSIRYLNESTGQEIVLKEASVILQRLSDEVIQSWSSEKPRILRSGSMSSTASHQAVPSVAMQEAIEACRSKDPPPPAPSPPPLCIVKFRRINGSITASKETYFSVRLKNLEDDCDPATLAKINQLKEIISENSPDQEVAVRNPYFNPSSQHPESSQSRKKKKGSSNALPRTASKKSGGASSKKAAQKGKKNSKRSKGVSENSYAIPRSNSHFTRFWTYDDENVPKDELTEGLELMLKGCSFFIPMTKSDESGREEEPSVPQGEQNSNDDADLDSLVVVGGETLSTKEILSFLNSNNLGDIGNENLDNMEGELNELAILEVEEELDELKSEECPEVPLNNGDRFSDDPEDKESVTTLVESVLENVDKSLQPGGNAKCVEEPLVGAEKAKGGSTSSPPPPPSPSEPLTTEGTAIEGH